MVPAHARCAGQDKIRPPHYPVTMTWLTSPSETTASLPAIWLIATDGGPANLAERSALRRMTARDILARQLGVSAGELEIDHDAKGRPLLAGPAGLGLHISLATRLGFVAVALARQPVGVDVERIDQSSPLPFAVLHARERSALLALPEPQRARAFARIWSAKEAYVKALGLGFARSPDSFCVGLNEGDGFTIDDAPLASRIIGAGRIIENGGQEILAAAIVTLS